MADSIFVERTISASADRVFLALMSVEQFPAWLKSVISVAAMSDIPFGVGFRWSERRRVLGVPSRQELWVTAFEEGRSFTVETESNGTDYEIAYSLVPEGESTAVHLDYSVDRAKASAAARMMARLSSPISGWILRRLIARDLKALDAHLSVEAPPSEDTGDADPGLEPAPTGASVSR